MDFFERAKRDACEQSYEDYKRDCVIGLCTIGGALIYGVLLAYKFGKRNAGTGTVKAIDLKKPTAMIVDVNPVINVTAQLME